MVAERWAANVLKQALGLTEEDMEQFQTFIKSLKDQGPSLVKRAEMTEKRTLVIARVLKRVYPEQWAEAEKETLEQLKAKRPQPPEPPKE